MHFNPVVWFEIHVEDMARAQRFYEAMLQLKLEALPTPGGEASDKGMQMLAFPSQMENGGAAGALVKMESFGPAPGGTLVYFHCGDCAVESARAAEAGGAVVQEKFAIGDYGFCALVRDSEGNIVGLHSMA